MECRCPTCLREEDRHADRVVVRVEGGQRSAPAPRFAAEWAVLRDAMGAGDGVVGPCPACQMPMLGGQARRWTLTLPDTQVTLDGDALSGPEGPLTIPQLDARVQAALPRESLPVRIFQTGLFAWLVVPLILWVCAFFCFSAFLCIGVPQGAEFMPR